MNEGNTAGELEAENEGKECRRAMGEFGRKEGGGHGEVGTLSRNVS